MALIESIQIPLGTQMPDFALNDPFGQKHIAQDQYGEQGLLIAFTCNHCPYAIAVWPRFIRLAEYAREKGINTLAVNPNINPAYPDDSPENMKKKIEGLNISFPYLVDETQEVARTFKAQCTPDIYLFNKEKELVYHGRIDDNWKDESKVTREELKAAIDCLVADQPIEQKQLPTLGCSIKWVQ